ncbi:MAG: hypothetical protein WKG07_03540 [Hymenobacter sp.]
MRTTPDTPGRGSDFYLAQFAPGLTGAAATPPTTATLAPNSEGDHVDGGTSRFDPRGIVYAAACSCFNRNGFPVPPGAFSYSAVNGSKPLPGRDALCNNAAFKLNFEPTVASVGPSQTLCATSPPAEAGRLAGRRHLGRARRIGLGGDGLRLHPYPRPGRQPGAHLHRAGGHAAVHRHRPADHHGGHGGAGRSRRPTPVCANNGPVPLTGGSPAGGTWTGPGVSGSVVAGFVFTPTPPSPAPRF